MKALRRAAPTAVCLHDLGAHGELHAMRRRAERRAAPAN
jgi:hypothetical protein